MRVFVGNGADTPVGVIDVTDIGAKHTGWILPATPLASRNDDVSVPVGGGTPKLIWDANGDGIKDFVFLETPPRSLGNYVWYAGRPCAWRPPV